LVFFVGREGGGRQGAGGGRRGEKRKNTLLIGGGPKNCTRQAVDTAKQEKKDTPGENTWKSQKRKGSVGAKLRTVPYQLKKNGQIGI